MSWVNELMRWDHKIYDNIRSLRVQAQHVWIPDIVLYNDVKVSWLR